MIDTLRAIALLLIAVTTGAVTSEATARRAGRPLVEVLREMEAEGTMLLYSDDLVRKDMRVKHEPTADSVHSVLEQLLGPHRLRPQVGPGGRVLIVRRQPTPIHAMISSPEHGQSVFGEVDVSVDVAAEEPIAEVVVLVNGERAAAISGPPFEVRIDVGEANLDREFTVQVRGLWGGVGQASVMTQRIRFTENIEVGLKQLYVTVSKGGEPLTGLEADDFSLWDDGEKQRLVTFGGGDVPLTAALLLDVSESMSGRQLEAALEGMRVFLGQMEELDQAMILMFSDRTLAATPFVHSGKDLLGSVRPRIGRGGTALTDHLYAGLRMLEGQQGRRVVVLLSDGADVASVLRMRDVYWKMRRGDSLVYWIRLLDRGHDGYSSAWRNAEENRGERRDLEAVVRQSGGRLVEIDGVEEIGSAFETIIRELRGQYVLGYYPERRSDGSWREVRVYLSRPRAEVRLRQGYVDD